MQIEHFPEITIGKLTPGKYLLEATFRAEKLSEVRALVLKIIEAASEDIREGCYLLLFLSPEDDDLECDLSTADLCFAKDTYSPNRKMAVPYTTYLQARDAEDVDGSLIHTHPQDVVSNICGVSGVVPTGYIYGFREVVEQMRRYVHLLPTHLQVHVQRLADDELKRDPWIYHEVLYDLAIAAEQGQSVHMPKIYAFMAAVYRDITGKIERLPTLGNITIFLGDYPHCGASYDVDKSQAPGEIAVSMWIESQRWDEMKSRKSSAT